MNPPSSSIAIVTGASQGIGRSTAIALANRGFGLYLVADGTAKQLSDVAAECSSCNGGAPVGWGLFDLGLADTAPLVIQSALEACGGIDVLVNNAGMRIRKPFGEFDAEDFDQLMAVNLRAPFLLSQLVLPAMRERGGGRIIHVASQLGMVATKTSTLYGMAKAALIFMAKGMAVDFEASGITVNVVSPGPIETEFTRTQLVHQPDYLQQRARLVPAGRMGRPEEVAELITFLATSSSNFIQGSNFVIDGGYIAQ